MSHSPTKGVPATHTSLEVRSIAIKMTSSSVSSPQLSGEQEASWNKIT